MSSTQLIKMEYNAVANTLDLSKKKSKATWKETVHNKLPIVAASILLVRPNLVLSKYFLLAGIGQRINSMGLIISKKRSTYTTLTFEKGTKSVSVLAIRVHRRILPMTPLVVPSTLQKSMVLNRKAKKLKTAVKESDHLDSLTILCSSQFFGTYSVFAVELYNTKTDMNEVNMARLNILFSNF